MEKEFKEGEQIGMDEGAGTNHFKGFIGDEHEDLSYAKQKYIALFKARSLLAQIGTMQERRICGKKLKQMKAKGLAVI